jgi:cell division protein FtsB
MWAMRLIEHLRYRAGRAFHPTLLLLAAIYLVYHAIQGNYGLLAMRELDHELVQLQVLASEARAQRLALEAKANRLRPDNLDPELLDEQARRVLGFSRRDEVIIFLAPSER